MNGIVPNPRPDSGERGLGLASWYTAGRTDGFGDRLLMFDNTGAASFELLRFRPDLAAEPGFEDMLRTRVQRLATFKHPSFAAIRAVEHLEDGDALALVSNHTAGKRLAELLDARRTPEGLHPAFVSWLVQQITPLLAALQAHGYDIVHGALTIDRIILTPEGRLSIVEHALGSALRGLEMSPTRLWRDFGIVARSTSRGEACLDARGDIMQVGVVALSLLLGRRVPLQDVQDRLPALLDEFSGMPTARTSLFSAPLRQWLERAMQIHPQAYRSAAEAQDGLRELPEQAVSSLPALLQSMMPAGAAIAPAPSASETPGAAAPITLPAVAVPASTSAASTSAVALDTSDAIDAIDAEDAAAEAADATFDGVSGSAADRLASGAVSGAVSGAAGSVVSGAASAGANSVTDVVADTIASAPIATASVDVRQAAPSTAHSPVVPFTLPSAPAPIIDLATILPPAAADLSRAEDRALEVASMSEIRPAPFSYSQPSVPTHADTSAMQRWIVIGLAVLAVLEAIVIGVMATRRPSAPAAAAAAVPIAITVDAARPGSAVFVNDQPAGTTPLQLTLDSNTRSIRIAADGPVAAGAAGAALPGAAAQAPARNGSVRFTAPIELQVVEGTRVLGSITDGAVILSPGTHQLELVNTELGFRSRQSVVIRAGETSTFTVTTPMGRLSLNAQPWAQVWVDQNAMGETPIANLAVPIGQHEITFRHPQLGERKETVTVRADGVTRLSTTFGR